MSTSEEETKLNNIFLPYKPQTFFLKTAYGNESTQASHLGFQISSFRLGSDRQAPKMGLNLSDDFLGLFGAVV